MTPKQGAWRLQADASGFSFAIEDAAFGHHARIAFRRYLDAYTTPDSDRDAAELIFGELVANVARHAPGPLEARLTWDAEAAQLEICDTGQGFNVEIALPAHDSESHRGLYLVTRLGGPLRHQADATHNRVQVRLPVWRKESGRRVACGTR